MPRCREGVAGSQTAHSIFLEDLLHLPLKDAAPQAAEGRRGGVGGVYRSTAALGVSTPSSSSPWGPAGDKHRVNSMHPACVQHPGAPPEPALSGVTSTEDVPPG